MKKLSGRQRKALIALSTGKKKQVAADIAGVTWQTIEAWMRDKDFTEELRKAEVKVIEESLRTCQAALEDVDAYLIGLVRDENAPTWARLQAAQHIREAVWKGFEVRELGDRLEAEDETITLDASLWNAVQ